MRDRIARAVSLTVLVLAAAWSAPYAAAQNADRLGVKVTIENLRHKGGDSYTLVVAIANVSSQRSLVRIDEEGFSIQTERSWAQLSIRSVRPQQTPFRLAAGSAFEREIEIRIPTNIPDVFRTDEGNQSLRYSYAYTLRGESDGSEERKTDEVYCWVKPGTSDWILREGM